ncbi:MAG: endonuclease MutS2 [Deltaproteobacteria bacterium]|nr:endonuclease MutS2 [Deltaproteobacteria bacterium]
MDETTFETLEYGTVLAELAAFASNTLGRENVLAFRPRASIPAIEEDFKDYSEVREFLKISGKLPVGGVTCLADILRRTEPEGAYLFPEDLMPVRHNLQSALELNALLNPSFERSYPRLAQKISSLSDTSEILSELNRILDDKGEIKDSASPTLSRIRREIRLSKERARSIIESVSTDKKTKDLLQEDLITIRDDRYVLCIKASVHTFFDGVIHGRSGSGASYFIEPLELVELNNRVAILKKDERQEEIEILKAVTFSISLKRDGILNDQWIIGGLDSIQAKALFANETCGVVPRIKEAGELKLLKARHPLLILKEKRGGSRVVPIDLMVPEECQVLVISGANTGGKTVALKTLGLLTFMALSGIPIPADEGSEALFFTDIFSDIGDRQDLIASLSTFSAHIKRIREFLFHAGTGSLVLLDEPGAGTDPSEGSALALAALETFRQKGAKTVVTTHLNLIKAHAQADKAYLNTSVEFDEKTLHPLYTLHYGVPGPSLGLAIAESLGIPASIIEQARKNIKEKEGAFIESVRMLEAEKDAIRKLKERLSGLEAKREEAVARLRADRGAILEKTRAKIEGLINSAKEEMKEAIEKMREEGYQVKAPAKTLSRVEEAANKIASALSLGAKVNYIPSPGDKVSMAGSSTKGLVLKVDAEGKKAELMVGGLKVWVAFNKLVKRGGHERARASAQGYGINADMEVSSSVNVIGQRAEQALEAVTKFIDNAHASGLSRVEIIHGVGTGRLSRAVEEYLKKNDLVKGFSHGDPQRGGAGVTVVELK